MAWQSCAESYVTYLPWTTNLSLCCVQACTLSVRKVLSLEAKWFHNVFRHCPWNLEPPVAQSRLFWIQRNDITNHVLKMSCRVHLCFETLAPSAKHCVQALKALMKPGIIFIQSHTYHRRNPTNRGQSKQNKRFENYCILRWVYQHRFWRNKPYSYLKIDYSSYTVHVEGHLQKYSSCYKMSAITPMLGRHAL